MWIERREWYRLVEDRSANFRVRSRCELNTLFLISVYPVQSGFSSLYSLLLPFEGFLLLYSACLNWREGILLYPFVPRIRFIHGIVKVDWSIWPKAVWHDDVCERGVAFFPSALRKLLDSNRSKSNCKIVINF